MSTSETTLVGNNTGNTPSCLQQIKESKWTDVALVVGFAALLIIGVLASIGIFNFMGTANALYLSYGMYGGAALLLIAELVRVAIKCSAKPKAEKTSENKPTAVAKNPLSQEEIQSLKEQATHYSKDHAQPKKYENPVGVSATPTKEHVERLKQDGQKDFLKYITDIIDKPEFQQDPTGYLVGWEKKNEYPDNLARAFFVEAVGKIRTLPETAK